MNIARRYGETGVSKRASEILKHIIYTWSWLLPSSGTFALNDLVDAIKKSHDATNPKTAHDLLVLRAVAEKSLRQPRAWQHGGLWFVSGYVNRKLRIYCPDGDKWEKITIKGG